MNGPVKCRSWMNWRHDWHGVRDACVDLELIEREMRMRHEDQMAAGCTGTLYGAIKNDFR